MLTSCLFFFFSSRRRHTRFDCDWSSDVCSSDLFRAHPTPPVSDSSDAAAGTDTCLSRSSQLRTLLAKPCMAHLLKTGDRKSTRLNSSHSQISYAVFCLKKKRPHTLAG